MSFNSLEFIVFFLIVYGLYIVLTHRAQNVLLLISSYVFYGWWDWRFLSLILISTLVDYICGIKIESTERLHQRRLLLTISMVSNLGILGFFKYYNFFASSLGRAFDRIGIELDPQFAAIVLPVGISFYTFQTMSYTIDVYRRRMPATRNLLSFSVFVAFFPQLVAGPIERASVLLPQIDQPRTIGYGQIRDGLRLILLGFVLKLVVAENMAPITKAVFTHPENYHGLNLLLGIYAAAVQVYGDFAGYTNIARGLAKMMGIELMLNFKQPYFATNPSDFWRRWHISLSTWLRDYLYISIGGNRRTKWLTYRNLMITMVLGGLWHGAAWNFVLWGVFHGGLLCLYKMIQPQLAAISAWLSWPQRVTKLMAMVVFLHLTCIGWTLFFVKRIGHLPIMLKNLLRPQEAIDLPTLYTLVIFAVITLTLDYLRERHATEDAPIFASRPARLAVYCGGVALLMLCGVFRSTEFIYFQF